MIVVVALEKILYHNGRHQIRSIEILHKVMFLPSENELIIGNED